jgi:PAS domain S-box-containing protein
MKIKYLSILTVFIILFFLSSPALAEKEKKNVLFLNSYQNGYAWSDGILDGVRSVLGDSGIPIDLHIEYMDTKRFFGDRYLQLLHEYYSYKYKDYKFSAIIVSDNNALNFMLKYHDDLFRTVPVFFCGINDYHPSMIKDASKYAGILENPDVVSNLNLARKFNPDLKKVIVISDKSVTSRAIRQQIVDAQPAFNGDLDFIYWDDMPLSQILSRARVASRDTVFLFTPFYKGAHGELFSAQEVLEILHENTPCMIFSVWKFLLGHGIVGGKLLSGNVQGRMAAKMAVDYLKSGKFPAGKVQDVVEHKYMFDYNVLKKFNISDSRVPAGSQIINEPDYFYKLDRQVFWIIIISIVALSIILILLLISIMQRRSVETRIKSQLTFQEILMDTIPLLICWKDCNQRYLGANRYFTDFFELGTPAEIIGREDKSLMPEEEFAKQAAVWDKEVISSAKPLLRMSWSFTKGTDTVWLEVNKVPVYNEKGKVVGTLSTSQDVTRRVNLEKQLLQSQKMEAIGTLAGGIAHDFNNILTSIINSIELAMGDVDKDTLTWKDLARAIKAARRGSRVVKQILTFSRPSQEGFRPTDLREVVREAIDFIKASLPRTIQVYVTMPEEIPLVMADPTQIHQVIMNLCTNSFQAIRENGGIINIDLVLVNVEDERARFMSVTPGTYLRLSISDDGPGISQDIMDKIFDPFFTTKGKTEGTGLGLAVVHGLIKGHGGGVTVSSTPFVKTEFDLYLPAHGQLKEVGKSFSGPLPLGREHILFVEDDIDQLETTPRLLESLGYTVTAVGSPFEALDLVRNGAGRYELVITDYDMPESNGIELAGEISRIAPELPVMLVSGRTEAWKMSSSVQNIRKILSKPYNKTIIADAIRMVLGQTEISSGKHTHH